VWDIDRMPATHSIDYLAGIARKLGRRAVLIPTADTAALFVSGYAGVLDQWFIFDHQSPDLVKSLYSKSEMLSLAANMGLSTPKTFFPKSKQDVFKFVEQATFPMMLKPVEDRRRRSKIIVHGTQELLAGYELLEDDPENPNVLLQEYIPGGEDANWMFNGYFDEQSDCLFGLTGKKIRQNPPYAGITSLGVCSSNPALAQTTKKFMKMIGYRGILDIGYRYDARDGRYKVFDVNPRIGCSFRLFVSDSGMDVARSMYLHLTGQAVVAGLDLPGRKWIVEDLDVVSSFLYFSDSRLKLLEWFKSFRGLRESAFFATDDLRPMLSVCMKDITELIRRSGGIRRAFAPSTFAAAKRSIARS
jgi:D-aspartate ligase